MSERKDYNVWPGLTYDDPLAARAWLSGLGFEEGILVSSDDGDLVHHSEMLWPDGGRVMASSRSPQPGPFDVARGASSVYVVVKDADAVWERAQQCGAEVVRELRDEDYGSRGFSVKDPEGNRWSFGTYAG